MVPMIIRVLAEGEVCEVPITPETTCADVIDCVRDPGDETCTLLQTWGHGYERVLKDSDKPYEILQEWGAQKDPCKLVLKYTVLPSPAINGRGSETRNGMKEPGLIGDSLPEGGCELTLGELEEMALRQQSQIESQRQQLAAREQRLRFLKQHEARHQQVAAEHERLRHLRDRVHLQELKLRKLRALRGQLHHNKLSNAALTSDLDSIRALFNEKEKELSLAVAKVEELTSQLEELRRGGKGGRGGGPGGRSEQQMQSAAVQQSAAALELEKLRRELMYRNKLNEQQTARLSQQREALTQRQEEVASIDKRIAELQDRLHRKRLLNQQLASQINAAAAANNHQQNLSSLSASTIQQHQQQQHALYQQRGNIAAVEPYHHVPAPLPGGKPPPGVGDQPRPPPYPTVPPTRDYNGHDEFVEAKILAARKNSTNFIEDKKGAILEKCEEPLPEFGASKSDPKYQTLPYNTKFGVNYVSKPAGSRSSAEGGENTGDAVTENKGQLMSIAHSTPVVPPGGVSRGLATQVKSPSTTSDSPSPSFAHTPASLAASRVYGSTTSSSLLSRGQPVGGASSTTSSTSSLATNSSTGSSSAHQTIMTCPVEVSSSSSITTCTSSSSKLCHEDTNASSTNLTTSSLSSSTNTITYSTITTTKTVFALPPTPLTVEFQKPISSVAPTSVQAHLSQSSSTKLQQPSAASSAAQELPSQIYQTSSTKIQPVQPQTLSSTPQGILRDQKSDAHESGQESGGTGSLKPALPPKPAAPQAGGVKSTPPPPPRQMVHWSTEPPGSEEDAKRPPAVRPSVHISADAVDSAINVLRGAVSISARGAMSSAQEYLVTKSSNSTYQPDPTDSSVPPPPPTTEPPADDSPTRRPSEPSLAPIKPRPLGIIKQQLNQQQHQSFSNDPRSRVTSGFGSNQDSGSGNDTVNSNNNGNNVRLGTGTQDVSPTYSSESSDQSPASNVQFSTSRRIEMPPAFLFPETEAPPADLLPAGTGSSEAETTGSGSPNRPIDENCNLEDNNRLTVDKVENEIETRNNLNNNNNNSNNNNNNINSLSGGKETGGSELIGPASRRVKKGNLKGGSGVGVSKQSRRVSFDPLALLLDASLEGELELVVRTAGQVRDPSAANDEGITALHNAICAGHLDIVRFLVRFGCDVNAQDSDGWTPLHCAASCNNLAMVKFLVEHGACIFATTLSDQETAAEKCEEDEEGFDGCSEYLYSVQEKLGILNSGAVFAVFSYEAHQADELSFGEGDRLIVLRKGDEWEREWWWTRLGDREGYVPRNLLGLYPRVHNKPTE